MSLFGDLPSAKNDATSGALVSTFSKRALIPPPSILRNKKKTLEALDTPGNAGFRSGGDASAPAASHGLFSAFGTIQDEYDPAVPNEYMKAKEDQEKAVLEADMEARRAAELRESAKEAEAEEAAAAADQGIPSTGGLGSSTAPGNSVQGSGGGASGAGAVSKAMKMMKGMGWSEGEGLGKERQGMATPIILQKTDKRTGVIVNAEPLNKPLPPQGVQLTGAPSRVVLLRNMVGPGEVDEGLEDEVAEEVRKFGDVLRVLIFEVDGNAVAPEQAVRIFVEMERVEAATKTIVALHGRFFDKKTISATFFDEGRFHNMDLAPRLEELQQ